MLTISKTYDILSCSKSFAWNFITVIQHNTWHLKRNAHKVGHFCRHSFLHTKWTARLKQFFFRWFNVLFLRSIWISHWKGLTQKILAMLKISTYPLKLCALNVDRFSTHIFSCASILTISSFHFLFYLYVLMYLCQERHNDFILYDVH